MAGEIYLGEGTMVDFGDGGTVAMDLTGLADGASQQSAQHNLGAAPRPDEYRVRAYFKLTGTAQSVGETLDVYVKTSDDASNHLDNDEGVGDLTMSNTDKLKNLMYVGSAVVDEDATGIEYVMSATVRITSRYVHMVVHNNTGESTSTTASENQVELTPIYYQSQ